MNTKKAYIKLDGKIGEKELTAVEYVDKTYHDKMLMQRKEIQSLLAKPAKPEVR